MSANTETLDRVGRGIVERCRGQHMPVRVRVGAAVFDRVYRGLAESEYEVEQDDGAKVRMWMRWSRVGLNVPHYLVYNTPVELHPSLDPETVVYDMPESM